MDPDDGSLPDLDRRISPAAPKVPPIKTGLRLKFASVIMLLVSLISVVFFLFFRNEMQQSMEGALNQHGLSLANNLAGNVEPYLGRPSGRELEILLSNVITLNDVLYVAIFNQHGDILLAKSSEVMGFAPRLTLPGRDLDKETSRAIPIEGFGLVRDFDVPIWKMTPQRTIQPTPAQLYRGLGLNQIRQLLAPAHVTLERVGTVRLGLSSTGIRRELQTKSLMLGLFFALFIGCGVIVVYVLSGMIVNPIQHLARAMKAVAMEHADFDEQGGLAVRHFRRMDDLDLWISTHDEIEQLADDFRAMVQKLEDSYARLEVIIADKSGIAQEKTKLAEELQALNLSLEGTIRERTREVVEKNLKLYELSEELQFQKEELVNMNEQLEKTSKMKSAFLANMSHELRTPLNSIIGFAEILKDKMFGEFNERQEKYLTHILTSGRHLLQLINNILDLSKVEAGKMKLNLEPFSINRVIDEVQTIIKTLAYKKNIEIQLALCPEVIMYGDIAKAKQILYNLLSNAIKFTFEKGTVIIGTREIPAGFVLEEGPEQKPLLVPAKALLLTVADTGIGIKPEDQERIFEEFEQTEQTRAKGYEGTGLGLALTRRLVHLHGGHIWVKSESGKGSEFFVLLPVKGAGPEEEPEEVREL